ncbi:hypothetical protein K8369_10530, partial [Streptomyces sp. PSKA30]|nr:hypothetical protein [Streptomyces sp. PSKA30]
GNVPPQRGDAGAGTERGRRGRQPQLPPRGGARAELPGGNQQSRPSWSDENAQPPVPRAALDTPRGHEEPDVSQTARMPRVDDRQGPGSTAEMPAVPRIDDRQGPGAPNGRQNSGQFVRPDVFGTQNGPNSSSTTGQFAAPQAHDNGSTGQYAAPQRYDNGSTGQFPAPQAYGNGSTGQFPVPPAPQAYDNGATGQFSTPGHDGSSTGQHALPGGHQNPSGPGQYERPQGDFGAQRPPAPQRPQQRPARPEPEALPPASGPGDGRTPLYDTLETNWFHGQQGQQGQQPEPQHRPDRPQGNGSAPAPRQPQASAPPQRPAATWRSSPNDDLVRQAERVRQPAAGGVTTSGLPRRVPRANLVPGTAQQQPHQSGPQVSRAPQDVRGRLTNLRRGIAQGRQAGSDQTGSFPSPTHQQER